MLEDPTEFMTELVQHCLDSKMKLPFVICGIGINGSVLAYRFREPGTDMEFEADGFVFPVRLILLDAAGGMEVANLDPGGPEIGQ